VGDDGGPNRCLRLAVLALLASVALAVAACGKSADGDPVAATRGTPRPTKKVALVIAQGGLGDKSYNDSANSGFTSAVEKTGVQGKAIESNDVAAHARPRAGRSPRRLGHFQARSRVRLERWAQRG
jgi:basic membrane lipoprotein Med (substrate-binding protein (PBP1-ABC) superfamily)